MTEEHSRLSNIMLRVFHQYLSPCVVDDEKKEELSLVGSGMEILVGLCKQATGGGSVWDAVAALDWMQDAKKIQGFLTKSAEKHAEAKNWRLTLGAEEDGQESGDLYFRLDNDKYFRRSSFAQEVERLIVGQEALVREWARDCLLVGYLGLHVLECLRPLKLKQVAPPESEGTACFVGRDSRPHLCLGVRKGDVFGMVSEWEDGK